ncbi:unnamed protein product [Calicophoron daubneyi]|uniref:Uncharacterized protein n=1 Tax=Calicophoron daubneyi TaxID=300641 RepID=A0AAV2TZQ0_CALDB
MSVKKKVNHIPNNGILTNKLGLLLTLREFERRQQSHLGRPPSMLMSDFFPQTFIIDDMRERETFFREAEANDSQLWISKPIGWNQGKGIFLVRDMGSFREHLAKRDDEARALPAGMPPRVVQRYISAPLLIKGRKFDIRCYMLVASTMPYLVLYHPGYVKLAVSPYSVDDNNLTTHLTNQYVQKKDPNYAEVKNDTVWNIEQLNDYVNKHYKEEKKLPVDWVKTVLQWRIQRIIYHMFLASKNRLATRVGIFELYGLDFLIDQNMKVWLLEANTNPAMHVNCDVLQDVLPNLIKQTVNIVFECFEKARMDRPLLPLTGYSNLCASLSTQRTNRPNRQSLDGLMDNLTPKQARAGSARGFGLPPGFSLIYSETQSSFQARWPMAQASLLRGWVVPHYRPPRNDPNSGERQLAPTAMQQTNPASDQTSSGRTVDSEASPQYSSPTPTNRYSHSNFNAGESAPTSDESSASQSAGMQAAPRSLAANKNLTLSEYRPFENSLRKYPPVECVRKTQNKNPQQHVAGRKNAVDVSAICRNLETANQLNPMLPVPTPPTSGGQVYSQEPSFTSSNNSYMADPQQSSDIQQQLTSRSSGEERATREQRTSLPARPTVHLATIRLLESEKRNDARSKRAKELNRIPRSKFLSILRANKHSAPVKSQWLRTSLRTMQYSKRLQNVKTEIEDELSENERPMIIQYHPAVNDRGS